MKGNWVGFLIPQTPSVFKWFLVFGWIQLWTISGNFSVEANFNFFLARREFQKLHGISSDIYYVREGVVNDYALNFVVTVPTEVDDLHFSWQALTKRVVYYDMAMEYTDFFALLAPVSNISNNGRVPFNLETFKVTLPCSGRSNAEVAVTIRMNFQVKHPKPNTTSIAIKRNKICLFKELSPKPPELRPPLPPLFPGPPTAIEFETESPNHKTHFQNNSTTPSIPILFQDPSPSLLLAGLLGGCAVTASVVFLIFFICLRRKLTFLTSGTSPTLHHQYDAYPTDPNSSSNNSSPACLLRQSQESGDDNQLWKNFNPGEKIQGATNDTISSSRSGSRNSYVTIASFWNDIFSRQGTSNNSTTAPPQFKGPKNFNVQKYRGSDVSPYAYAHIVPKAKMTTPTSQLIGAPSPSLIQWYSQSPCQIAGVGQNGGHSFEPVSNFGPIYSNNLGSFNPSQHYPGGGTSSSVISASLEPQQNVTDQYTPSTLASNSGSLIQVDGFQCRHDFRKETNVVERFL